MANPAAAIETATATSAVAAFANCTATLNGVAIDAIFYNGYSEAFNVDGSQPMIEVTDAAAIAACGVASTAAILRGTAAVVNGVSYTVQGKEPDGTGMTRLLLEEV